MSRRILILHGPNLNLLGKRDPELYGSQSLDELNRHIQEQAKALGVHVECRQSNVEGQLIDWLQEADGTFEAVVFNPGGYSHTSVAIRDAVEAISPPVVEVHMSHVDAREAFRQAAIVAPVCIGRVSGFGAESYVLGLRAVLDYLWRLAPGGQTS